MSDDWRWPHFTRTELACRHCGAFKMDDAFLDRIEHLRALFAKPMPVSSAYRCPEHNARVSSTGPDGPHTTGKAIDILVAGSDADRLLGLAYGLGFTGKGVSQKGRREARFIHIDDLANGPGCPRPTIWSY